MRGSQIYKILMLMAVTDEHEEYDVELPPPPIGYHFVPSPLQLIQHYLLTKIPGLNMMKTIDSVELIDPFQLDFGENKYCYPNEAYYITKKREKKTDEEGKPTIIKTASGYWKESGEDSPIFNDDDQIVGYQKTFTFYKEAEGEETLWKLNEYTPIPEIISVDVRAHQMEDKVAYRIRYEKPEPPEIPIIYDDEEDTEDEEDDEEDTEDEEDDENKGDGEIEKEEDRE